MLFPGILEGCMANYEDDGNCERMLINVLCACAMADLIKRQSVGVVFGLEP